MTAESTIGFDPPTVGTIKTSKSKLLQIEHIHVQDIIFQVRWNVAEINNLP